MENEYYTAKGKKPPVVEKRERLPFTSRVLHLASFNRQPPPHPLRRKRPLAQRDVRSRTRSKRQANSQTESLGSPSYR